MTPAAVFWAAGLFFLAPRSVANDDRGDLMDSLSQFDTGETHGINKHYSRFACLCVHACAAACLDASERVRVCMCIPARARPRMIDSGVIYYSAVTSISKSAASLCIPPSSSLSLPSPPPTQGTVIKGHSHNAEFQKVSHATRFHTTLPQNVAPRM